MKLFTAIHVPRDRAEQLWSLFDTSLYRLEFEPIEKTHITLRFFGEGYSPDVLIPLLRRIRFSAFPVFLHRMGTFPLSPKLPPRVLWAGTAPTGVLRELYKAIDALFGPTPNALPFTPHVTLAKARPANDEDSDEIRRFVGAYSGQPRLRLGLERWQVTEFVLYGSPGKGQPYVVLERFPLWSDGAAMPLVGGDEHL